MLVWRRWIFPILMVIVCGAIAASLVKIAFFPDASAEALAPEAQIADPVVAVERTSIVDELDLEGTIARDESFPVRSTIDGTVTKVHGKEGQTVTKGQVLFSIKQAWPVKTVEVKAPEAGELAVIAVVKGQPASIGGELATFSPERYHVLSTVDPVQLYRLIDAPSDAEVAIQGGPAPFTCTGLDVQVAEDGTTSVRCAVPRDQTVFAGLRAEVGIRVGSVDDALVVPATAVKGGSGSGVVWVDAGGAAEERKVELGISDGARVQVTSGLDEGDLIRQFVPGIAAPNEPVCWDDGNGGEFCEDQGWNW